MALKVEKRDGTNERIVVRECVKTKEVLGTIASRWKPNLFPSRYSNLIVGWCVEHYQKYHDAPGRLIQGYFDSWSQRNGDEEGVRAVEGLLAFLSDESARSEKVNYDYVIDLAANVFETARLRELSSTITSHLENNDLTKAQAVLDKSQKIELGLGSGIDVWQDEDALDRIFNRIQEGPIVKFPGALGNFFASSLSRDRFIGMMGKEKVGKSYILQRVAWEAIIQNNKVAYFEVGDSSEPEVLKRFYTLVLGRPFLAGRYRRPVKLETNGNGRPDIEEEWTSYDHDVTPEDAQYHRRRMDKMCKHSFKLSCHPNSSISVSGISSILEGWDRDGWHPDCVVVDYADILAPVDGRKDNRDQINDTWKALRALSQRLHCLVLTATQTDTDSYTAVTLKRENFSEDKRKYGHVNGMMGINQTSVEKEMGVYRFNWTPNRDLDFPEDKCVYCAGSLDYADPAMLSSF